MTRTIRSVLALVMLLSIVMVAGRAQAAEPLTEATASAVEIDAMNAIVSISSDVVTTAISANCQARKRWQKAYFKGGEVAFHIWQRGSWCWRRGDVTSFSWSRGFYQSPSWYNQWKWQGWEGTVNGGGVGKTHVYRRSTGHFRQCLLSGPIFCSDRFPWISQTLRGTGGYVSDSDG